MNNKIKKQGMFKINHFKHTSFSYNSFKVQDPSEEIETLILPIVIL